MKVIKVIILSIVVTITAGALAHLVANATQGTLLEELVAGFAIMMSGGVVLFSLFPKPQAYKIVFATLASFLAASAVFLFFHLEGGGQVPVLWFYGMPFGAAIVSFTLSITAPSSPKITSREKLSDKEAIELLGSIRQRVRVSESQGELIGLELKIRCHALQHRVNSDVSSLARLTLACLEIAQSTMKMRELDNKLQVT